MNPILREFPDQIETERLLLRSPLPGDGGGVRAAVVASQEELKQWMPWAMEIPSEEEYEVRVREGRLKFLSREDLWMMIVLQETEMIIGGTGLHRMDWEVPRFEIGYWLHSDYTGRGLATEAVIGLADFAFETLGARRVEIRCDARNERSAAVARRAGFPLEATLHHHERHHLSNELRDTLIFARIREE